MDRIKQKENKCEFLKKEQQQQAKIIDINGETHTYCNLMPYVFIWT